MPVAQTEVVPIMLLADFAGTGASINDVSAESSANGFARVVGCMGLLCCGPWGAGPATWQGASEVPCARVLESRKTVPDRAPSAATAFHGATLPATLLRRVLHSPRNMLAGSMRIA